MTLEVKYQGTPADYKKLSRQHFSKPHPSSSLCNLRFLTYFSKPMDFDHESPQFRTEDLWQQALPREKLELGHIYQRLFNYSDVQPISVRVALYIEVLNEYDHRKWPTEFLLHDLINDYQRVLQVHVDATSVDFFQRANYLKLALAGCNRQRDVAYGLSDVLDWRDETIVVDLLLLMGRRQYSNPVPRHADMDNNVLHITVSYKHTARYDESGTLSPDQAAAIWRAVRVQDGFEHARGVRIWLDQNLHRGGHNSTAEWHEYGLLPYACLPVVYIGDGDCSVRLAETRPWLWVELLAGIKANGVLTAPGHDILQEAAAVLRPTEAYSFVPPTFQSSRYILSSNRDVDGVMDQIARLVSFWRPQGFLNHEGYEYVADFLRFVNWARRFVLRGVPYSKMRKSHSSNPVVGMDAVVLVRSLPREVFVISDAVRELIEPKVSWTSASQAASSLFVVGDIFDRTLIDDIPLHMIVDTRYAQEDDRKDCILLNENVENQRIRFRKVGNTVTTVLSPMDTSGEVVRSRKGLHLLELYKDMKSRAEIVCVHVSEAGSNEFISYSPFTMRFFLGLGKGNIAVGDAEAKVRKVPDAISGALHLKDEGVCLNLGICEIVYRITVQGGSSILLSTNELMLLLVIMKRNIQQAVQLAFNLKQNAGYKQLWYDDLSSEEVLEMTSGWPLHEGEAIRSNERIISGELADTRTDVVETLRARMPDRVFVTVHVFTDSDVQIVFRERKTITHLRKPRCGILWGMFSVDTQDRTELVAKDGGGLLQVLSGCSDSMGDPEDRTLEVKIIDGIFALCTSCKQLICCINGLVSDIHESNESYLVTWNGFHSCKIPTLELFRTTTGKRLRFQTVPSSQTGENKVK